MMSSNQCEISVFCPEKECKCQDCKHRLINGVYVNENTHN